MTRHFPESVIYYLSYFQKNFFLVSDCNYVIRTMKARNKRFRKSYFLLISLCIHIVAFSFFARIILHSNFEFRESVDVQLVKTDQQVRKIRRDNPIIKTYIDNRQQIPAKVKSVTQPIIRPKNVSTYANSEMIPIFHYESPQVIPPSKIPLKITPIKVNPQIHQEKVNKPLYSSPNKNIFEINQPFLNITQKPSFVYKEPIDYEGNSKILRDFLDTISKKIEKSKLYPQWAMETGIQGRVIVRFTILKNGTLEQEPQLIKSSGSEILDNAAIMAVKAAIPFPEIPESLKRDQIHVELPMEFILTQS